MNVRKLIAGATVVTGLTLGTMVAPAAAVRPPQQQQNAGAVAGLVAAIVQAQVQDVEINVVEVGDVNVQLQNVLNNNRILTDFLNDNNVNIEDVVDINIVDNVIVVDVL